VRHGRTVPPGDLVRHEADACIGRARADCDHDGRAVTRTDQHVLGPRRAVEEVPLPETSLLPLHDEQALARDDEEILLVRLGVVPARVLRIEHRDVEAKRRPRLVLGLEPRASPHAVLSDPADVTGVDDVPATGLRGEPVVGLDEWSLVHHSDHLPRSPRAVNDTPRVAERPTPIIVDCDPGHDDAIALLLALASPEIDLLGVTTTYGNQTLEKTTANALRVLELAGRSEVPVASGANQPLERELVVAAHVHGESGLDGPTLPPPSVEPVSTDAVGWVADAVRSAAAPVTLVPTGPLTNIAQYLVRHGTDGVERIVLMGGAIAEGNMTPAAEFNIWADPEAAQIVFDAELDVTMLGLDVTHKAVTGADVQRRLRETGSVGVFVAELVDFFTVYHRQTYGWDGAPIHDAVAVAHVLAPDLVATRFRNVEIERVSELCRGRTVVDLWLRTERPANAHVGVDLDTAAFFDLLVERIARLG
jgi:inosine-uridine nucleoside N-ribohydrolase